MTAVLIETSDCRIVPAGNLRGVAELAVLFNDRFDEMHFRDDGVLEVTRQMVSTWASRSDTSMFPAPVVSHLSRGLLWDIDDFVDPKTNALKWAGPPGRWGLKRLREAEAAKSL